MLRYREEESDTYVGEEGPPYNGQELRHDISCSIVVEMRSCEFKGKYIGVFLRTSWPAILIDKV